MASENDEAVAADEAVDSWRSTPGGRPPGVRRSSQAVDEAATWRWQPGGRLVAATSKVEAILADCAGKYLQDMFLAVCGKLRARESTISG